MVAKAGPHGTPLRDVRSCNAFAYWIFIRNCGYTPGTDRRGLDGGIYKVTTQINSLISTHDVLPCEYSCAWLDCLAYEQKFSASLTR